MSKEKPNYYAILPANVRYDNNLNANEKIMYSEITALAQSTGQCWASNKYFSDLYNVTPQAVSKWIKNIERLGYIKTSYVYKKGTKMIEKRYISLVSIDVSKVSTQVEGGINTGLERYQHTIKDNNTSINNTSINNNPIVPLEKEQRFKEFWEAYPKKVNKKRAMTAYNKISKKTHDIIIKDLETRVDSDQWKKDKGKYIPNPTTYLNGERWNDEVEVKESVYRVHATLT